MTDARVDVMGTVARFFDAVDGRDWPRVEAAMSAPLHLDYESFGGGPPAELAPSAVVQRWRGVLPGFDHTHHQLGNLDVALTEEGARVRAYVTATHGLDGELWVVRGRYEIELGRAGGAWRITHLRFLVRDVAGLADLPTRAGSRVAKAG